MPDPTNLAPPHVMTTAELIIYASAAVATAVGGVVAQTLRFGARVKALEADAEQRKLLPAAAGATRDEMAALRAEVAAMGKPVDAQAVSAQVLAVVQSQIQQAITLAVANAVAPLQQQVTRLEAQHQATKDELERLRDTTEGAAAEGVRRWNEMARELGSIHRALKE